MEPSTEDWKEILLTEGDQRPEQEISQLAQLEVEKNNGRVEFAPMVVRAKFDPNSLPGNYDQFTHELKLQPYNTSIITRMEIDRTRFVDPDELLDRIPGESQTRNLRIPNGGKSYTIPMLDGVAQGSPYRGATQDFADVNSFDIERIEIIKGPVSALYPNNAFGGVINVVTREAPETPESGIWAEAGNFDRFRWGAQSAGKFDQVGYFFDLNGFSKNGFRDDTNDDRLQGSAKLIFHPFPDSKLTLRTQYIDREIAVPRDLAEAELDADSSQGNGNNRPNQDDDVQTLIGSFKFEWEPYEAGKWDVSMVWRNEDVDGISRFTGNNDTERNDVSLKGIYAHDFDLLVSRLSVGADLFFGDVDFIEFDTNRDGTPVLPETVIESSDSTLTINTLFAQYEFEPMNQVRVTAGLRAEFIKIDSDNRLTGFSAEEDFSTVSPKIGFTHQLTEHHTLFANFAQGFLAPDIDELFAGFGTAEANPDLDPEEADHFDIGLRGTFMEDKLAYETSFYYTDVTDFIVETENACGDDCNLLTNAGEVEFYGVESVVEYWPIHWLRLGLTHTFAENEYKKFINSGDDLSGNEIRRSPNHHINMRAAVLPIEGLKLS